MKGSFQERRYLAQDGLSLYYREYGMPGSSGTPVLCLSGLTRNSRDFHHLARRLSASRRVVCPDYRGRGKSDYAADPDSYHPAVHVSDIRHLLVAAGLHRVVLIGTSFGGFLGMGLALVAPTAIAAMVLNDVGPEVSEDGTARIMGYVGRDHPQPDWPAAVAEMKRMFPTLSFKTDAEWLAGARGTWREGEDGMLHFDWDTRLAKTILDVRGEFDPWTVFHGLRDIPVLALRGGVSDVLSPAILERMVREHPRLTAVTVPHVGHPLSLSEPEAAAALRDFLTKHG